MFRSINIHLYVSLLLASLMSCSDAGFTTSGGTNAKNNSPQNPYYPQGTGDQTGTTHQNNTERNDNQIFPDGGAGFGAGSGSNKCNDSGRIVVTNDEWQFSDTGFRNSPDAGVFAQNIVKWLGDCRPNRTKKFHAYSNDFSLTEAQLSNTLQSLGYSWTSGLNFTLTLENMKQYDWIFLANIVPAFDAQVFKDYVAQGGGLYIAGGTAGGAAAVANQWNPLIADFGIQFQPTHNFIEAVIPIASQHPIFDGVQGLYQNNGNSLILNGSSSKAKMLVEQGGHGLYAIYDGSLGP